jgi:hypothetical protein
VSKIYVELFTPSPLDDPAEGRALLQALNEHAPSWMPRRYGWTEPLRHVYVPERTEHFWSERDGLMFRNERKTATGHVRGRLGPWDILSKIELSGTVPRSTLEENGIGGLLAGCGTALDLAYAMAHVFTDKQADDYYAAWFDVPAPEEDRVRTARQGPFPYYLRDLYWGNVFGPPYVELFGADRLRTAPAAVVTELRDGCFYLQVTDTILDLSSPEGIPRYRAARDAVKNHLGPEFFYEAGATTPRRAPHWRTAAEDGLWDPPEGFAFPDELMAMVRERDGQ